MGYVLGIDLGTGSLKGVLYNREGECVYEASKDYPLFHPENGYCEQHPKDWSRALDDVIMKIAAQIPDVTEKLESISFSGQMHGLVTLTDDGTVIRPAILWNDTRTTEQSKEIEKNFGEELIDITRNKPLEGFTLPKILWLQENEPENWKKVKHILLPKDYLVWYLTGKYVTDTSDAAGTLLLDIEKKEWSQTICEHYQISTELLPTVHSSSDFVGNVMQSVADKYGFHPNVRVAPGGADNACAALGAGIIDQSTALVSVGTSGVVLSLENEVSDSFVGQVHLFNHAINNSYYSMAVTLSAGHSLHWFKDTFAPQWSYDELLKGCTKVPIGAENLLFAPYIVGERTPYSNSHVRGSFIGIDTRHTLEHFVRAVVEGITYSLNDCKQLMEEVRGKKISRMVSVGGASKSPFWLQMQADIFNCEIITLASEQGPALGAALCARVVAGWDEDIELAISNFVKYKDVYYPQPNQVKKYEAVYQKYRKIYAATKDL